MEDTSDDDPPGQVDHDAARREDTVAREWERTGDGRAAAEVVAAVAAALDVDPVTLPPLAHRIDPDSLDDLLADAPNATVRFTYAACRVRVTSRGTVHVVRDAATTTATTRQR
ncbi:HalOD1 output domain-containing protein [Halobacterium yunchengense]|uniref:HalOD1 output domain-containing protein n=1 Tax=Halobacterium yunchengense TaxID=3108497 RepID=UPI00300B7BEA